MRGVLAEKILEEASRLRPTADEARLFGRLTAERRPVAQRLWTDLSSLPDWRSRLDYARENAVSGASLYAPALQHQA
jgi:hypothetical protein